MCWLSGGFTRTIDCARVRISERLSKEPTACTRTIALRRYRSGNCDKAGEVFKELLAKYPHDAPSRILLERCRCLYEQPPEGAWDGVFVMKTSPDISPDCRISVEGVGI
jgi:hypothetical protein